MRTGNFQSRGEIRWCVAWQSRGALSVLFSTRLFPVPHQDGISRVRRSSFAAAPHLSQQQKKGDAAMEGLGKAHFKWLLPVVSLSTIGLAEEHTHIPWSNRGLEVGRSDAEKPIAVRLSDAEQSLNQRRSDQEGRSSHEKPISVRRSDAEQSLSQRRSDQEGRSPHEKPISVRRSDAEQSLSQRRSDQEGRSPHEKQISTQRSPCEGMWHSGSDFKR